jgi:hypothetical protein
VGVVDVDKNAQQAFEMLEDFFPERAVHLRAYISTENARVNALDSWREDQLIKFIGLLVQNVEDMVRGYVEKRVTKIGWAVRNILELSVWIGFCNVSSAHAKQFHTDAARDLEGFRKAVQKLEVLETGSQNTRLVQTQKDLATFAQKHYGVSKLDDDFTKITEAAKLLGLDRFPALYSCTQNSLTRHPLQLIQLLLLRPMREYV